MPKEKTLKNTILVGIFLLPFVGLITSSSFFFPYITAKNIAFRLIVLLMVIGFSYLAYKWKENRPKFGNIAWSLTIFIAILFFADLFGQAPHKSFFSNFERMEGFFTLLLLFCYFIIFISLVKSEKLWERLLITSLASSVIMAIYGLVQQSNGIGRLDAQLGNSTYLGAFMLFNIFFALILIMRTLYKNLLHKTTKWFVVGGYSLILLLDLYIFYYTGTRGALLGLFAGAIFI